MSVEEKLKEYILQHYKSMRSFSITCGVPQSTIMSMLKNGIKNSGVNSVIKICETLSIDVAKLNEGEIEPAKKNIALDVDEFNIINQYRVIDNSGKSLIRKVTSHEYERCTKADTNRLNEDEQNLIEKYRNSDDKTKKIISSISDMSEEVDVYRAAMSEDDHPDEIIKMSKAEIERLLSLPMTDEDL